MSLLKWFGKQAQDNENEKAAKAALQEKREAEAIVMQRMYMTMDKGDLGPYYNRSSVSHNEAGGITPKYPLPWNMPPQQFQDMLDTSEGLNDEDLSQIAKDYNVLNGNAYDKMDNVLQKTYMRENGGRGWKSANDNNEVNIENMPEGGY